MGSLEFSTGEFSAVISNAARMNSSLAARERVTRMQIDVLDTIPRKCWRKAVLNEERWTPEYGRLAVRAIITGVYPAH